MGQCGCGEFQGVARIAAPEGRWYGIDIPPPCRDCDTPAGVVIALLEEDWREFWEGLPIVELGDDLPEVGFSVLSTKQLHALLEKHTEGPDEFVEIMADDVVSDLREAVDATVKEWAEAWRESRATARPEREERE